MQFEPEGVGLVRKKIQGINNRERKGRTIE
jgi:hypothetical protein